MKVIQKFGMFEIIQERVVLKKKKSSHEPVFVNNRENVLLM